MDERRPFSSLLLGRILHSQGISAGIFASQENTIDETEQGKDHDAGDTPAFIARQQSNEQGHDREAAHGNNRDPPPAKLVAEMAKERGSNRTTHQGQGKDAIVQRRFQSRAQGRWLEVRHGRPQDDDGQIHVEHVNKESDEGGAQRSLAGMVCNSVGRQTLTERNWPKSHIKPLGGAVKNLRTRMLSKQRGLEYTSKTS